METEKKRAMMALAAAFSLMSGACVPAYGPGALRMMPAAPYGPPLYGPAMPVTSQSAPIGRWDNVMMLPGGAALDVLTTDGQRRAGTFISATYTVVRVQLPDAREVQIAASDVVRIDRWLGGPQGASSATRDAAKGAAVGAGAVGVLGLLAGRLPPARVFAAGAIASAYQNEETARAYRHSVIVYLAAQSR